MDVALTHQIQIYPPGIRITLGTLNHALANTGVPKTYTTIGLKLVEVEFSPKTKSTQIIVIQNARNSVNMNVSYTVN